MKKAPEDEEEPQPGSEVMVTKKHPLNVALRELGVPKEQLEGDEPPKDATYNDVQGYVSELGRELSRGTLDGDVFQAVKFLQNRLLDRMQRIAAHAGVGQTLRAARSGWRAYQEAFFEPTGPSKSGSPLAQSLLAKDPTYAIDPLTQPETAARIRNMLAQFDPPRNGQGGGAALFDNFRRTQTAYERLPKQSALSKTVKLPTPPRPTPMPEPPRMAKATPVKPNLKPITPEALTESRREILDRASQQMRGLGKYDARLLAASALGILPGFKAGYFIGPILVIGEKVIGTALENPHIVELLAKPTEADLQVLNAVSPQARAATAANLSRVASAARVAVFRSARNGRRFWQRHPPLGKASSSIRPSKMFSQEGAPSNEPPLPHPYPDSVAAVRRRWLRPVCLQLQHHAGMPQHANHHRQRSRRSHSCGW